MISIVILSEVWNVFHTWAVSTECDKIGLDPSTVMVTPRNTFEWVEWFVVVLVFWLLRLRFAWAASTYRVWISATASVICCAPCSARMKMCSQLLRDNCRWLFYHYCCCCCCLVLLPVTDRWIPTVVRRRNAHERNYLRSDWVLVLLLTAVGVAQQELLLVVLCAAE